MFKKFSSQQPQNVTTPDTQASSQAQEPFQTYGPGY